MAKYQGGKVVTGIAATMEAEVKESQDVEVAAPKIGEGAVGFKALKRPLNMATANGRIINFTNGYFTTEDKALIEYLRENAVGRLCEEIKD